MPGHNPHGDGHAYADPPSGPGGDGGGYAESVMHTRAVLSLAAGSSYAVRLSAETVAKNRPAPTTADLRQKHAAGVTAKSPLL